MKQTKKYAKAINALDKWKREQIKKGLPWEDIYYESKENLKRSYLKKERSKYGI